MKKLLSISLAVVAVAGFFACNKANPTKTGDSNLFNEVYNTPLTADNPLYPVGRVPLSFKQKALLEEVTGEWCGNCPDGAAKMKELTEKYPDVVYGVAFHAANNEPFEIPGAYDGLIQLVAPGVSTVGFPSASVNRTTSVSLPDYLNTAFDYRDVWANQMAPVLKRTPRCGLALVANEENDNVTLDVFVGYNTPIADITTNVTIYVIEDDVPESAEGAQASGNGTLANPYIHQHVLRQIVTAQTGDAITLNNATKEYYTKKTYSFSIAGKYRKKDNVKIIAMVNKPSANATDLEILNVQEVALDEVKKWN